MKISILLPYKENFSPNYPGAVSIFLKDTINLSKFNKKIRIYGNTNYKKKLLKNYVNLSFLHLVQTDHIWINLLKKKRKTLLL